MKKLTCMLLALAAGCSDVTAPEAALYGRWQEPRLDVGSGLEREHVITFHRDNTMDDEVRIYRSGQLTDTFRWRYDYVVRNDSLFTAPQGSPAADLAYAGTRFDRGKLLLDGNRLRITYPWFGPADEPITVTQDFYRSRCLDTPLQLCL